MSREKPKKPVTQEAIDRIEEANERNPDSKRKGQIERMERAMERYHINMETTDSTEEDTQDMSDSSDEKEWMTPEAAARIQSNEAKKNNGKIKKGSFAAKAQSAAAKNVKEGKVPSYKEGK